MTTRFTATKKAEKDLGRQLKKVADVVGGIISTHLNDDGTLTDESAMMDALTQYAETLEPWARSVTAKVLESVNKNNERHYNAATKEISKELKKEVDTTPTGELMRLLQEEQVVFIKSLPLEAGIKAQEISREAALGGIRASESAKKIENLGDITRNRAVLIARTETAKANYVLGQARAQKIGATHYIWRTMEDADVRESHRVMEGTVQRFDSPPAVEGEGNHAPGMFPNCRCYAEPIITI